MNIDYMQGKERNISRIDKQFEDRSWNEMSKILDKEMPFVPVKENGKKRYLLLLLILFIGFASGIGTMFYFNRSNKVELPAVKEIKKEIAVITDDLEKSDNQNLIKPALSNAIEKDENQNTGEKREILNNKANDRNASVKQKINTVSNNLIAFENNSDQNKIAVEGELPGTVNQTENQSFSNNSIPKTQHFQTFDFIDTKSQILKVSQNNEKINLLEVPKEGKWSFGVSLGAYTNNLRLFAGISIGGKANYNLDRRFILGAGLQYSILSGYKESTSSRTYDQTLPVTNAVDSSSFEMLDQIYGPYRTIESSSGNTNLPITNLHYVEIPIDLSYRLSKNFQIQLGVKTGYLVKANAEKLPMPELNNLSNYSSEEELNNKNLYQSLNKFNLGASIGIGFYPTKNLGFDLQYNHGLVDITRDDVWLQQQVNTNNNLQLSMIYYFGK